MKKVNKHPATPRHKALVMQPPLIAIVALLISTFLTSMGYGILLPVTPGIVAGLHTAASPQSTALHTGLVTAVYAGAAFLAAPLWGRFSDRMTSSTLIAVALAVTGIATMLGTTASSLAWLYFWRFAAGAGAGAVLPATQAWFSRWAKGDKVWTSKRVVWSAIAQNSGFLIGPFVGGFAASLAYGSGAGQVPFFVTGVLLLLSAATVIACVGGAPPAASSALTVPVRRLAYQISPMLTGLLITATAVAAFEVALTLKISSGRMQPLEAGLLLAECTLFMSAAQITLVIPRVRDLPAKTMVPTALIALAAGLIGAAAGTGTASHVVSTALFALGGGLLPPLLSRQIADADGGASGSASGLQSAATQAGQTLGSILAGTIAAVLATAWIFSIAALPVVGLAAITIWNRHATKLRPELPEPGMGSTYRNSEKEIL